MVHLNPSDSLALQKIIIIIIQMTYSDSWLCSCEFGLHPKQQHPEQERPTFLIPDLRTKSFRRLRAARLREPRREASPAGFVGTSSPRDGAGLGKQAGLGRAEPAVWHPTPCSISRPVTPGGCGRHHSLMNAFAVKIQSSAVETESLVRNLQHLPVCCFHASAARARTRV